MAATSGDSLDVNCSDGGAPNIGRSLIETIQLQNFVFGISPGKVTIIKNRYGDLGIVNPGEMVKLITIALSSFTGISLFDSGISHDLEEAFKEVLEKHNINLEEQINEARTL